VRFLTWLVTTALALAVATLLIDGIYFTGNAHGQEEIKDKLVPLLVVALIFGVITSFVKPILTILSIPFIVVTLGLFYFLLNILMLYLTDWVVPDFEIDSFWWAVLAAIIVSVVNWVLHHMFGESEGSEDR
jgi:putative membrane protein